MMASRACHLLALALCAAAAAALVARDEGIASRPGLLSCPITYRSRTRPLLTKRATNAPLFNVSSVSYLISLNIGTPGQPVRVAVDTGSDELWVDPICNSPTLEEQQQIECRKDGQYIANTSSTSAALKTSKDIPYGKGEVLIDYYTDTINQPESGITLSKIQFGVARLSEDLNEGIMGLGFGRGKNLKYNNFVDELVAQNITASRAFTIALGSVDAANGGVIIFGGVDTRKFAGPLHPLPLLPPQAPEPVHRYWVALDSVGISQPGGSGSKPYSGSSTPIVIDSGSSLSYLPAAVVRAMAADLHGQYDRSTRLYFVPCTRAASTSSSSSSGSDASGGSFDFVFSGVRISVPFSEFIWNVDGRNCVLGAAPVDPSSGVTALLGDTFMRSAYTVFDQTSGALWIAPYVNCGQNEQVLSGARQAAGNFTGECPAPKRSAAGPSACLEGRVRVWLSLLAAGGVSLILSVL